MADVGEADEELLDKEIEDLVKKIIQVENFLWQMMTLF